METKNVGIDDIAIDTGNVGLTAEEYAEAKGEPLEKLTKGLGIKHFTLPDTYEDPATMGANAALKLMEKNNIEPEDVQRIAVGTESSWDRSKPLSTYISGMLEQVYGEGSFNHAGMSENKFACIGGTQALNDMVNEAAMEWDEDDYGLVVATDTALYEKNTSGEPTQGAGAVAMLVSQDPDVVDLSHSRGRSSRDETDFLKPNQQFPEVDGKRSMKVYLDCMKGALDNFKQNGGDVDPDNIDYVPFHIPFPKMAKKAAPYGLRNMARGTEKGDEIIKTVGEQPRRENFESDEEFLDAEDEYVEKLIETDIFEEFYEDTVEPALQFSENTGNWYTGSVHLARAAALQDAMDEGLENGLIVVGSYGSGAQAEVHAEEIQEGFEDRLEFDIEEQLGNVYELGWEEYEQLHDHHNYANDAEMGPRTDPEGEFKLVGSGKMGERQYEFVE